MALSPLTRGVKSLAISNGGNPLTRGVKLFPMTREALKGEITMKTKEELNEIKEEVEKLDTKLHELTEEELEQVTGGCKFFVAYASSGEFA